MTDTLESERLAQLIAFARFEDCVDETELDHADLIALGDDALSDARRPAVQAHLERCAYCRQIVEEYRAPTDTVAGGTAKTDRPPIGGWLLAIAAAVAVFFGALVESPSTRGTFAFDDVRGLAAPTMDDAATDANMWSVGSTSTVEFVARPSSTNAVDAAVSVGVFVETSQGTYFRAPAQIVRRDEGEAAAFRVTVRGLDLLRGRGTGRRLALVVASDERALDELEGVVAFERRAGVIDFALRELKTVR